MYGEALRNIFLDPRGELWGGGGVQGDDFLEAALSGGKIGAEEDAAYGFSDSSALVQSRHVGLCVLLEVELAPLPGDGGKNGGTGGPEAGMVVADEEFDAGETAGLKAREELAPVDLGLAQGDADTENGALAVGADTQGDEDGAIDEMPAVADLFVTGVEEYIGGGPQGSGTPEREFDVEFGGAGADLGGTDGGATEFFDDGRDFAGGNALNVHFGQSDFEGLFAADALVEGGGIELQATADLWDIKGDAPQARGEGFVLVAVGVAEAGLRTLVGFGSQGGGALTDHGFVDEEADALSEAIGTLFGEQLHDGGQEVRVFWVGHR